MVLNFFHCMMNITSDPFIIKALKTFRLGIIQSKINCQPSTKELQLVIEEEVSSAQDKYSLDVVNKINIIAETRIAYKKLGNDPNRYRPSADSLVRRIVKGMGIYYINNVVDILNLISIQSGFSIGGYDLSSINGQIELGIGKEGEPFRGIGRGDLNITNLPVLRDSNGAFGSPTSDSERTMIKDTTMEILFIFFDFGYNSLLDEYLSMCADLLSVHCSASGLSFTINLYQ